MNKDERIEFLETEITKLGKLASEQIPFAEISAEAKTNYENLSQFGFSRIITTDFNKLDTIPMFEITWKDASDRRRIEADTKKLKDWLKLRLKNTKIQIKEIKD